uniref:IFNL3 protein n=1 Tax=Dromaius novaehollandiae TaxID=8790 RepID=A0A8C4KP78_DRONO
MQRAGRRALPLLLPLPLLLLAALGPSPAGAFPRGTPRHRSCGLSKYRFLLPAELKKPREEGVNSASHRGGEAEPAPRCLPPRAETPKRRCPQVPDRMMLVEAELDLVMAVLEHPGAGAAGPAATPGLTEPLALQSAGEAPAHQPSGKLRHWLHKLETAKQKETAGCLEASAILHLFQVLSDLKCTALREDCT